MIIITTMQIRKITAPTVPPTTAPPIGKADDESFVAVLCNSVEISSV